MIHCYAGNECQNIDVVKAISNRHRVASTCGHPASSGNRAAAFPRPQA